MKRANPAQLRQPLEVANTMVKHGIGVVCMAVVGLDKKGVSRG